MIQDATAPWMLSDWGLTPPLFGNLQSLDYDDLMRDTGSQDWSQVASDAARGLLTDTFDSVRAMSVIVLFSSSILF
jgi:hypothetical protein